MNDLLNILFSLSLSGTIILLSLLVLRPLFGKYLSKAWQYYIWLIVLVRLLVPLALPISPVGNLFTKAAPSIQALQVPLITSPMLVGICTPFLVLPDMNLEETDLYYIFVHELTHYKRRDILYKWAVQIVICLHWFNPFVYSMRKKLDKDCELSCDEMVIRALDAPEKRAYGDTLLHAIRKNSSYTNSIVSVTLNQDARLLKERLELIMNYTKKTGLHTIVSVLAAIMIAFGAVLCGCVVPVSAQGNDVVTRESYVQQAYYENSYIVEIAWNIDPDKFLVKLPIELDQSYVVGFPKGFTHYADNEEVVKAVTMAIKAQTTDRTADNYNYSLVSPMVADVAGPFSASANELSERFYQEKELVYFSAVIKKADQTTVKSLLRKAYDEDELSFYNILLSQVKDTGKVNSDLVEQAYLDDKLSYFTVMVNSGSVSDEAITAVTGFTSQPYLVQSNPVSVGTNIISDFTKRSYHENKVAFFTVL